MWRGGGSIRDASDEPLGGPTEEMGKWEPGKFRDEAVWGSHLCWTCSKIGYQFDKLDIECVLRFLNDNLII